MGRRRLLVPEARAALQSMKNEIMAAPKSDRSLPTPVQKGQWTTREAGAVGGPVGGDMVRRLVHIAKQELEQQTKH